MAFTDSQIATKIMTISYEPTKELIAEDFFAEKQKLLGQQIQELVTQDDGSDVSFDTGW